MRKILIIVSAAAMLASCTSNMNWSQAMKAKMAEYAQTSREQLSPDFKRAGAKYPPSDLALLVFKNTRQMQLYADSNGRWRYIKTYPVLAASGGYGPKLHEGDDQVPEGIYTLIGLNPKSHFDLSMQLDYPNAFDRQYASMDGRSNLGGSIFIHGNKKSVGCIAIGDDAIQQLFPLVYRTGEGNVTIIVAPDDLRRRAPIYGKVHPTWLPILYANISDALKPYPVPK